MKNQLQRLVLAVLALSVSALASVPASPGALNYVEGRANIGKTELSGKSVGQVTLAAGQVLETSHGKVEVLLTPGTFMRLNDNSTVRMISPSLTDTEVELLRGQVLLEVTDLHKENNLRVLDHRASIAIEKNGLYRFDADNPRVSVLDGKALVSEGDQKIELKKGHTAQVDSTLNSEKFDVKASRDDLYNWRKLRSGYLSEASAATAQVYVGSAGWYGPGWHWRPWYSGWSFLPCDPFLLSPFGYGFYSPYYFGRPFGVYRGGGFVGARAYHPYRAPSSGVSRSQGARPMGGRR